MRSRAICRALLFCVSFALVSPAVQAQMKDGFGKTWSPIQVEKSKKKGQAAVDEAKAKAEGACDTKFDLSIDWEKFDPSTYKLNRFEPYHIGMRCGDVFGALSYLCGRSLEAKRNVRTHVKRVVCSLHPAYPAIMKWRQDNGVTRDERALLQKDSPKDFAAWFKSDCVTGPRLSPTKHVLCALQDGVITFRYSVWSANTGSEIQGFLKKYFAE